MDKKEYDWATFQEFLPACIGYCMFSRSEVLGFCFNLIDEDKDNLISKQDIFK
jgi:Ca2+-binding EF-hand superfamily protein